jgi:hypothetical protein
VRFLVQPGVAIATIINAATVVCRRFISNPWEEFRFGWRYRYSKSSRKHVPLLNKIVLSQQQLPKESTLAHGTFSFD